MTDGPSREEIERVREALERHDRDLRDDDDASTDEPDEALENDDDER